MRILGIDPGVSGAIALFETIGEKLLFVHDLPVKKPFGGVGKTELDLSAISALIPKGDGLPAFAVIEGVHSMPGQGVASMFRFGQALGQVEGIVGAHFIPYFKIAPSVWKGQLALSSEKSDSVFLAKKLFPLSFKEPGGKRAHNRAEAALLALYGALYCQDTYLAAGLNAE